MFKMALIAPAHPARPEARFSRGATAAKILRITLHERRFTRPPGAVFNILEE